MKHKIFNLALLILTVFFGAFAQESGSVNINITLHPIQILTVNPGQQTVNISYDNAEDYIQGVSTVKEGHLTVFSTSAYEISVKSAEPAFKQAAGQTGEELSLSGFQIAALLPADHNGGRSVSSINLQSYKQNIISSMHADLGVAYDIVYQGMGNNAYLEKVNSAADQSIFSTRLIYSIETK